MARTDRLIVRGEMHGQAGRLRQPLDETLSETYRYVLNHQYRGRKVLGERGKYGLQDLRASSRGTDGNDPDNKDCGEVSCLKGIQGTKGYPF